MAAVSAKPLGIIELLTRIGEEQVRLQNLIDSATNFETSKRGQTAITFLTQELTPSEVFSGQARSIGLVLWLPTDRVRAAEAAHAAEHP